MRFFKGRTGVCAAVGVFVLTLALAMGVTYIAFGAILRIDAPIIRNIVEPISLPQASYDALSVAQSWNPTLGFIGAEYAPVFSLEETEDAFFDRMRDIDRRSLYTLTRDFPEILENGWSYISFDVFEATVNPLLDAERGDELRERILSGGVTTTSGAPIHALDGMRSLMLVYTEINQTAGYMAISYDKSKVGLSMSYSVFEGRWSTVREHAAYVGGIAAIPANNYTYNSRMGYGVVDGGFTDAGVVRYKPSGYETLYLGFKHDGTFAVGEFARYGMYNFSEGQGTLLIRSEVPVRVVVPDAEQQRILAHLADYVALAKEAMADPDNANGIVLIKAFIESFEDYMLQARYAWVIRENTPEDEQEAEALIAVCNELGADSYAEESIPVRSAFTAIGQRSSDGATFLFGIGGAKNSDVKDAPGNGATAEELQSLFKGYGVTNAAITTSGNRVGFAWKDQSLLKVQDTTSEGGRTYGAYYLE